MAIAFGFVRFGLPVASPIAVYRIPDFEFICALLVSRVSLPYMAFGDIPAPALFGDATGDARRSTGMKGETRRQGLQSE